MNRFTRLNRIFHTIDKFYDRPISHVRIPFYKFLVVDKLLSSNCSTLIPPNNLLVLGPRINNKYYNNIFYTCPDKHPTYENVNTTTHVSIWSRGLDSYTTFDEEYKNMMALNSTLEGKIQILFNTRKDIDEMINKNDSSRINEFIVTHEKWTDDDNIIHIKIPYNKFVVIDDSFKNTCSTYRSWNDIIMYNLTTGTYMIGPTVSNKIRNDMYYTSPGVIPNNEVDICPTYISIFINTRYYYNNEQIAKLISDTKYTLNSIYSRLIRNDI